MKSPLCDTDRKKALKSAAAEFAIINGWKQAFSECDKNEMEWLEVAMHTVFDTLHKCGATIAHAAGAIEPWMGYQPSDYALGY